MRAGSITATAFSIGVVLAFGTPAMSADLPKEGTFSGTYSGIGTFKGTQIGKERFLAVWDENALTVGKGIWDHVTWHGFGLQDVTSGMTQYRGNYVGTDPDGDKIVVNLPEVTHAADAKNFSATLMLTTGTGKYAGISGSFTSVCTSEFRTAAEGTYAYSCTNQGSYKLP
jgi:hypothetical protein